MSWNKSTKILYGSRSLHKKRTRLWIAIPMLLVIAGAGYGLHQLLFTERLMIQTVEISGIKTLSESKIQEGISEYLNGVTAAFFPRRNYLFTSKTDIAELTKARFPEIEEITVSKEFPDAIHVTLKERTVWGVLCAHNPLPHEVEDPEGDKANAPCVYIDMGGIAFMQAPLLEGTLTKKIFIPEKNFVLGEEAISPETIALYGSLEGVYGAFSMPITSLVYLPDSPRDFRAYSGNWYSMLDTDVSVEKLKEVLKPLLQKELAGKFNNLEYIDLRFGNKVFYKLK